MNPLPARTAHGASFKDTKFISPARTHLHSTRKFLCIHASIVSTALMSKICKVVAVTQCDIVEAPNRFISSQTLRCLEISGLDLKSEHSFKIQNYKQLAHIQCDQNNICIVSCAHEADQPQQPPALQQMLFSMKVHAGLSGIPNYCTERCPQDAGSYLLERFLGFRPASMLLLSLLQVTPPPEQNIKIVLHT